MSYWLYRVDCLLLKANLNTIYNMKKTHDLLSLIGLILNFWVLTFYIHDLINDSNLGIFNSFVIAWCLTWLVFFTIQLTKK